jgi:hypothetical protein
MAQKENVPLKSLSEQIQNIGVEKIEEQLQRILDSPEFKADFSERGRILIKHYIKFEDIVERVIDGLQEVGLNIV